MRKRILILAALVAAIGLAQGLTAQATEKTMMGAIADQRAAWYPWHGGYRHTAWGTPVALVVPPTAEFHTEYGWGVTNTRVVPIYHQFKRPYYPIGGDGGFLSTPQWPSDTTQFGVYYIRGPW